MATEKIRTSHWASLVGLLILLIAAGMNGIVVAETAPNEYPFTAEEQKEIDEFLAEFGSDVKAVDHNDYAMSLLHKAVRNQHRDRNGSVVNRDWGIAITKFLVSKRADVNARNEIGWTPLHTACMHDKNIEVIKFLVANGADVNAKGRDMWDRTPLHYAVTAKNLEVVRFLASQGADVNAKDGKNVSVLNVATQYRGNDEIILFLVSSGADVNAAEGWYGNMPLHWAARTVNDVETIKTLVSKGADVNAEDQGYTILHSAGRNDNVEVAKFFVSKGLNVNARDRFGNTPLYMAAWYNKNIEVIQFLIAEGADINAKTADGESMLHAAAHGGNSESAKFFISKGLNVNARDNEGNTPLHWAARVNKNADVVKILVSAGADVNASTAHTLRSWLSATGKTPLGLAKENGNTAIIEYLESIK